MSSKNNYFDMFFTFKITCLAEEIEESRFRINNHSTSLWKQLSFYFKYFDMSQYKWIIGHA